MAVAHRADPDRDPDAELRAILRWGIKRSLLDYVAQLTDGAIDVSPGVVERADGTFEFPLEPGSGERRDARGQLHIAYQGSVSLRGHRDRMVITLIDPAIVFTSASGVFLTTSQLDPSTKQSWRRPIAVLDVGVSRDPLAAVQWNDLSASLSHEGSLWLSNQYPEGQPLDSISFARSW